MSDFEKFEEEWINKETFCSLLTDRKITGKEYEHASNVRKRFEMKTMKNYHGLYLKCPVLLLVDAFEKSRDTGLKNYGLSKTLFKHTMFKLGCNA